MFIIIEYLKKKQISYTLCVNMGIFIMIFFKKKNDLPDLKTSLDSDRHYEVFLTYKALYNL